LDSPSIFELRNLLEKKGMITMYQNGLMKVFQNITTLKEVVSMAGSGN
jgi:type II secretory ATPase GspE/PulE/Tfp pilus assembly ATPase PilB-like protein